MTKIILSIVFVGISIASFVFYVKPTYAHLNENKALIRNYDAALSKARQVQEKINELVVKRNEMSNEDLSRLSKMVPTNVDNIQLILDIEGIAKQYNMKMQKVNISQAASKQKEQNTQARINIGATQNDLLKSLDLSFEVVSSYDDFIRFIIDLEHSLRIVDIVSLQISAGSKSYEDSFASLGSYNTSSPITDAGGTVTDGVTVDDNPIYTFSIVVKTYWVNDK